jgi:hypothetical protein
MKKYIIANHKYLGDNIILNILYEDKNILKYDCFYVNESNSFSKIITGYKYIEKHNVKILYRTNTLKDAKININMICDSQKYNI